MARRLLTLAAVAGSLLVAAPAGAADDATPPAGAVGGVASPADGTLRLYVRATDSGAGLASVTATLGGSVTAHAALSGSSAVDVPLALDTTRLADGAHKLRVQLTDAAGNAAVLVEQPIEVRNARPLNRPLVVVRIGGGHGTSPQPGGPSGGGGDPGRPTRPRPACRRPRLTMLLAQRPVRMRRHAVVLRKGKRYRFKGRLTCRRNGRRRAARRGTAVRIVNVVRGRRVVKGTTKVRRKARIRVRLGYRSSRTVVFRHRSARGHVSSVRLRVRVAPRRRR